MVASGEPEVAELLRKFGIDSNTAAPGSYSPSFLHYGDRPLMDDHFGLLWIHVGFGAIVGTLMLLFVA